MAQFLITYDNKLPRDYAPVYKLMAYWRAVPLSESVWLASLNARAPEIRDLVLASMQPNDIVTVTELVTGADWAVSDATNAPAKTWLSHYVRISEYEATKIPQLEFSA